MDLATLIALGQNGWVIAFGVLFLIWVGYDWYYEGEHGHEDVPKEKKWAVGLVLAFLVGCNFTVNGQPLFLAALQPAQQQPGGGAQPGQTTPQTAALLVSGLIQNYYTHTALGSTTTVELLQPNNYAQRLESLSCSSGVFTSAGYYSPGTQLMLHIYSTDGSNTYYSTLVGPVTVPSVSSSNTYNQQIYWLGTFYTKQRCTGSQVTMTLTNSTGYSLSSATGTTGTTNTLTTNAGFFSAQTSAGKTFQLRVNLFLTTVSIVWGYQDMAYGRVGMPVVTSSYALEERVPVMWLAVNNTGVALAPLQGDGWILIPNICAGYYVFYRQVSPVEQVSISSTSPGTASYLIDIDTSAIAAGKNVTVCVWLTDLQNIPDAANGNYNAFPSAKGAFGGYGQTALMPATGYFRTSSNAPTGFWLGCKFLTSS